MVVDVGRPHPPEAITVTHEFLALLLGVRRPGVTDTLNDLEGKGLIRSNRGKVSASQSKGLEPRRKRLLRLAGSRVHPVDGTREGTQPRPDPCVYIDRTKNFIEPLEGAMQRQPVPR